MESRRLWWVAMGMLHAPPDPGEIGTDFHEAKISIAHLLAFSSLFQWLYQLLRACAGDLRARGSLHICQRTRIYILCHFQIVQ